jgi:hypothetical protein
MRVNCLLISVKSSRSVFGKLVPWRYEAAYVIPRGQSLQKHSAKLLRRNLARPFVGGGCDVYIVGFARTGRRQERVGKRGALHSGLSDDLASGIDAISVLQKRRIGSTDEGVQFRHRAVLPKESTAVEELVAGISYDLASVIDSEGQAENVWR